MMSKSEFKKSLEQQRKLVDAKEREQKARMEATEAAKMIANMVGNVKRITNQKRHIMEAFELQREEEKK